MSIKNTQGNCPECAEDCKHTEAEKHLMVFGNLSQAAQFDGGTNGKIESVALMAWNHAMNYEEYIQYADAAQTIALSASEYEAIRNSWSDMDALVKECAHRILMHGISEPYDSILLHHWDSNNLFNQRNHTE